MKAKHRALLDFQKKLILSANQQTRVDALNIYRIVCENLREFVELRLPEEPHEDMLENVNDLAEVYHQWGISLIRRFPALANFKPTVYLGKHSVVHMDCDAVDPTRFVPDIYHKSSDDFAAEMRKICNSAASMSKAITLVHCWTDVGYNEPYYEDSEVFGSDVMHAIELYTDTNQVVYSLQWRYNFFINFANHQIFDEVVAYLDGETYDSSTLHTTEDIETAHNACMQMPLNVFTDPTNPDILCRTPFYLGDTCVTPLEAFNQRIDLQTAEEIWMTLYRTDTHDWDVTHNIIMRQAMRLKEKFHIYIELLARGDTRNNLKLYEVLKDIGADVHCRPWTSSNWKYKVHAKVIVARAKNDDPEATPKQYWKWARMVSTGNFVTKAAQQFRDTFFISMRYTPKEYGHLSNAFPHCYSMFEALDIRSRKGDEYSWGYYLPENDFIFGREKIKENLERIITGAIEMAGLDCDDQIPFIWIKVNNITSVEIINRLLDAVRAGVFVRIITRSGCCIPSEISYTNLQIKSIAGKYLEHDRFLICGYYKDDPMSNYSAPFKASEAYIMSSDLMERNLERRIEFMCKMPEEYETGALASLYANIFDTDSEPVFGFFNFALTPCWLDYSADFLDELFPLEYDGDELIGKTSNMVVDDTLLDGDMEFEKEVLQVFERYGRDRFSTDKFLRSLQERPSKLVQMKTSDGTRLGMAEALQGVIEQLLQSGIPEAEELPTMMSEEDMETAVERAMRDQLHRYMVETGQADEQYIQNFIDSVMGMSPEVRDAYVAQLKISANSHIGMPTVTNGIIFPPLAEPVGKNSIPQGLQNYLDAIKLPKEAQEQLLAEVLNTPERRRAFAHAMDWIDAYVSVQKSSITGVKLVRLCEEPTQEQAKLVEQFWAKFTGDKATVSDRILESGLTFPQFWQVLEVYRGSVEKSASIDEEDVRSWIEAFKRILGDGGNLTKAPDWMNQSVADKFWSKLNATPNDMRKLAIGRGISWKTFYKVLDHFRSVIEIGYDADSDIDYDEVEGWIDSYIQQTGIPDYTLHFACTQRDILDLMEERHMTNQDFSDMLNFNHDAIYAAKDGITIEQLRQWIEIYKTVTVRDENVGVIPSMTDVIRRAGYDKP